MPHYASLVSPPNTRLVVLLVVIGDLLGYCEFSPIYALAGKASYGYDSEPTGVAERTLIECKRDHGVLSLFHAVCHVFGREA